MFVNTIPIVRVVSAGCEGLDHPAPSEEQLANLLEESEERLLDVSLYEPCDLSSGFLTAGVLMNRDILTVKADEPVMTVSRLLLERRMAGAPVVDDQGTLVGVVSASDVAGAVGRPERLARLQALTVGEIMTTYTLTAGVQTSLIEVLKTMLDYRLHRVVVVDEAHRPMGLICSLDVARLLNQVLQELRNQIRRR